MFVLADMYFLANFASLMPRPSFELVTDYIIVV